jgi:hypothetical protein
VVSTHGNVSNDGIHHNLEDGWGIDVTAPHSSTNFEFKKEI